MKKTLPFLLVIMLSSGCDSFRGRMIKADEIAGNISSMISTLEEYGNESVKKFLPFFENPLAYKDGLYPGARYEFYEDVMYHNPVDQGHGKFLYSGYFPVGEKEKEKVKVLENVIPRLQWLADDSEYSDYITQTYLITFDTLIIFYPWSDLISFIPPKRNIMDRGGWKALNRESDPERVLKWTPPYVDTTGKGFMVDVMFPVDNGDFMEAFLGIDIIISTFNEKFLNDSGDNFLLVDKLTSQIFAISPGAVEILGVENADAFRYLEMIDNSTIYKQVMPDNLVLEKTTSLPMQELWKGVEESENFEITLGGKKHRVYRNTIQGPDWYLLLIE